MIVTCRTPQCENAEIRIDLGPDPVDPDTGEATPRALVVCGVCGQVIDDREG